MACTSPSVASAAPSTSQWGPWVPIAIDDPFYINRWTENIYRRAKLARGTVHSATALHWQLVANGDGKVLEDVWLYQDGGE